MTGVVLLVVVAAVVVWVAHQMSKHQRQAVRDRLLRESELAMADAMTGPQFERYVADLLRFRGLQDVRVVGGAGDGGIDILAKDSTGAQIACQCKRQMANVSVTVVRQLIGSVNHEHRGRTPYLVTTAMLTRPAQDLARQAGVHVIDRPLLGAWMADVRSQLTGPTTGNALPAAGNPVSGNTAPGIAMAAPTLANPQQPVSSARSLEPRPVIQLTAPTDSQPPTRVMPTIAQPPRPVIRLSPPTPGD
jgi:restriction system protein